MAISNGKEAYLALTMSDGKTYYYRGQGSTYKIETELSSFILKGMQLINAVDQNLKPVLLGVQNIVVASVVRYGDADKNVMEALDIPTE